MVEFFWEEKNIFLEAKLSCTKVLLRNNLTVPTCSFAR